jgi:pimeloyl-ACP methyl ester carboxylesterase
MVAMWIAAHHPHLVRALILGDNMILSATPPGGMYPSLFAGLRDLARKGGTIEELARGLAKIRVRVPGSGGAMDLGELPGNDEAYLRSWARYLQQVDPDAYEMTLDGSSIRGWDGEALLKQIQCPTLLLQANPSLGGMMSDHDANRACTLLAHPVRVKFPTLGHALFIQHPEPILRAATNFLESLEP